VVALAVATVGAALSPALAVSSAAPDVDLSSVDTGVALSSADGIEVLATEQMTSPASVDPPPIHEIIDTGQIGAPPQVGAPACQFSVKVHFIKSKTSSGVVHVTAKPAIAAVGCSLPNSHMDALVTVHHDGASVYAGPLKGCSLAATDPCMATQSSGSVSCTSGCTGYWWGEGSFNITLASGAFLVGQDPQCEFSNSTSSAGDGAPSTYHCVFTGNRVKM